MKNFYKKSGFTLSEVMITLSLVGVLATLTVATVGSSVQEKARVSEYKAAYKKLEDANQAATFEAGRIMSCYRTLNGSNKIKIINPNSSISEYTEKELYGAKYYGSISAGSTECYTSDTKEGHIDKMARLMNAVKVCDGSAITKGCIPRNYPANGSYFKDYDNAKAYVLDNSMILFSSTGRDQNFGVDINGRKGPNRWGQDIFPFSIALKSSFSGSTLVSSSSASANYIKTPAETGIYPAAPNCEVANANNTTIKTSTQMMLEMLGFKSRGIAK